MQFRREKCQRLTNSGQQKALEKCVCSTLVRAMFGVWFAYVLLSMKSGKNK